MTPRFTRAIALAARAHEGQARKGTPIPYITHPVAVAGLVAQYGGDEDQLRIPRDGGHDSMLMADSVPA